MGSASPPGPTSFPSQSDPGIPSAEASEATPKALGRAGGAGLGRRHPVGSVGQLVGRGLIVTSGFIPRALVAIRGLVTPAPSSPSEPPPSELRNERSVTSSSEATVLVVRVPVGSSSFGLLVVSSADVSWSSTVPSTLPAS